MKPHIRHSIAAALLAGSFAAAHAITPSADAVAPLAPRQLNFVKEPAASAIKNGADEDALASSIAKAINDESTLAGAKISVQNDKGVVYLMGSVVSEEQAKRAGDIARESAGESNVVNAIIPDTISYRTWQRIG